MLYKDIRPILYADDTEAFDKIFENGKFSYTEPVLIDQLDMYDDKDAETAAEEANRFGCKIDENTTRDVWIPAGLPFHIAKGHDSYTEMIVSRNGVSYFPNCVEDDEDIEVEFTEFGQKLQAFANSQGISLFDAYIQVTNVTSFFGLKIE